MCLDREGCLIANHHRKCNTPDGWECPSLQDYLHDGFSFYRKIVHNISVQVFVTIPSSRKGYVENVYSNFGAFDEEKAHNAMREAIGRALLIHAASLGIEAA